MRCWCYSSMEMAYGPEFREIGHCGGKITVIVSTDANGHRDVSTRIENSLPRPAAWFAVYALPQGIPVAMIQLGGIGQPWNPAPYGDCLDVFIGSDSLGLFGHQCQACEGYWRSKVVPALWDITCPYCGMSGKTHQFLTIGQRRFVKAMCDLTMKAANADTDGEHTIDMDQVADEVAKTTERPRFYYTEKTQQNHYTCTACGGADDILGRYGYCSCCGTRNDLQELALTIETINAKTRERIKAAEPLETAVPDVVSAFDSVARQYAKQLAKWVPMKPDRRVSLEGGLFHNLTRKTEDLKAWFGIDLFQGLDPHDVAFIRLMFYRRHVYEHNGGEVDQKYLDDSGDTAVRLKQALRETPESIFKMTGIIPRMARNLHEGFHELFPPMEKPITIYKEHQGRLSRRQGG
jgi:cytochrome c551/c552